MRTATVRRLGLAALLAVLSLAAVPLTHAQVVTTSSLRGTVTDDTGAPLPGANVVAVHTPSGTRFGAATRSDGQFTLPNLRVGGPYTVTVSFVGFRPFEVTGLQLALGQEQVLDARLRAADLGGEVVVTADANDVIDADRTGASTQIAREQIVALPTINRSVSDFTRLSPQSTGNNQFGGRNNLYNNISVDGSVLNNVFGLSSEVGGQTRSQVVSLDAVEQIQVSIAPYDVRQGSFTGAGINVVTRAGTNDFTGAAYSYLRSDALVGGSISGVETPISEFSERRVGLSVGGPIVRNRAFFFANVENLGRTDPGAAFRARTAPTETGPGIATVDQATLDALAQVLRDRFNYDPGTTGFYDLDNGSTNVTARFDVNLNEQHRASVRFNFLDSFRDIPLSNSGATGGGRQNSGTRIPFSGANYSIVNDVYSVVGQLNSTFGSRYANQATVGYTALRDSRNAFSTPFPLVDIENGAGATITSFGYEPFTANNRLDTDIFQLASNFSAFLGRHVVTVGTSNEFYSFANGFTPQFYGAFRFRTAQDFIDHVNAPDPTAPGVPQPSLYQLTYSAVPGVEVPLAEVSAAQLGLYVQDEFQALPNLRLTAGLRMDVPVFTGDLPENATVAGLTFADGETIDVSRLPSARPLFSPRIGFNYDVLNNRTYQLRGGTGVFTGRIPFVWISNQASNNGVLFGSTLVQNTGNDSSVPLCQPGTGGANQPACQQIVFTPDRNDYVPANAAAPTTVLINATADDFRFPQVWRTNLALDARLPADVIATLEGIYTRDLNAVFHRNANLTDPLGTFDGPDNRPRFARSTAGLRINQNITQAIVLDNTSQGYQYSLTGQLQRSFTESILDGLFTRLSYTYGVARDLTSSTSSIAATAFNNNQISTSPNAPELSFSNYDQRHRVIGVAAYTLEAFNLSNTTLSLVYVGGTGQRYSYTYGGDMNGDGISGNDLIYVPRDANDPNEILITTAGGSDTRTEAEIRAALEAFIAQDPYLSSRRGQIAERNGANLPWIGRVDLGLRQAVSVPVGGGRRTSLELSFDLVNFGNLLSSSWGVGRQAAVVQPIVFRSYDAGENRPVFSTPVNLPAETFRDDAGVDSRWQALFGIRLGI